MRINFDFIDLHTFLAVAELGSFQRAAESLHLSQSAVTRRIQKLEESLGVSLFERTTRSLKMTMAAKRFRQRARALVDNAKEAVSAIGDDSVAFDPYRHAIITIATIPTATHHILPQWISRFRQQGFSARIRILDLFANDVIDAVAQGEADFGISFMGVEEPGLSFQPMQQDDFVVAMHRHHPLANNETLSWDDLAPRDDIAIAWRGSGNRMLIDDALAKNQQSLNWAYQVRHSSTLLELVRAELALAIVPASVIGEDQEPIIARPLVSPNISRTIGCIRRTSQPLTHAGEAFFSLNSSK